MLDLLGELKMNFDWTHFSGSDGGLRFQTMCTNLLEAMGFIVQERGRGGHDAGKDIVIYRDSDNALLARSKPWGWVECKSITSGKNLSANNIAVSFGYLLAENIPIMIFMTNTKFTTPTINLFERINSNNNYGVKVSFIDVDMLEKYLTCYPKVYEEHFSVKLTDPVDIDCKDFIKGVTKAELSFFSEFADSENGINLTICNFGKTDAPLKVFVDDKEMGFVELSPLQKHRISIPFDMRARKTWPQVRLERQGDNHLVSLKASFNRPPQIRVDSEFVDPHSWRIKVGSYLRESRIVYISGGAGVGKTRLLMESAHDLNKQLIWIDLSDGDYGTALINHIIAISFGLDVNSLVQLPPKMIRKFLYASGLSEDEAEVVVDYLKETSPTAGVSPLVNVIATLSNKAFKEKIVVIDNIHRLSFVDTHLFDCLVSNPLSFSLICSARNKEIENMMLFNNLELGERSNKITRLDLGDITAAELIDAFIKQAGANQKTRKFLKPFCHTKSFQQFFFALKIFKAKGVLNFTEQGQIIVSGELVKCKMKDYKQLFAELMETFAEGTERNNARKVLELAAVYGLDVEAFFIYKQFGEEAREIINELVEREVLRHKKTIGYSSEIYSFDHELTRHFILESVGPATRAVWNRKVIEFLRDEDNYVPGEMDGRLGEHYHAIGEHSDATISFLNFGNFRYRRGGIRDAEQIFEKALASAEQILVQSQNEHEDETSYIYEAQALEGIIKCKLELFGPESIYDFVRRLDTLMQLYPADNSEREPLKARINCYFANYHVLRGNVVRSRNYITKSIAEFRRLGKKADLAASLDRAGNIEKKGGEYLKAVDYAREAIKLFKQTNNVFGLSYAYLNCGAIFLEAGRPHKTVFWWRLAKKRVEGRVIAFKVGMAQTDYGSIVALMKPSDPDTLLEIQRGLYLAEKIGSDLLMMRGLINMANHLFFDSGSREHDKIKSLIKQAEKLAIAAKNDYIFHLCVFSMLNMQEVFNNSIKEECFRKMEEFCLNFLTSFANLSQIGDNRITNMLHFTLTRNGMKLKAIVIEKGESEVFKPFIDGNPEEIAYFERNNPYFRNGLYRTFY